MSDYPQPGLHPDADTLNAFVESALPEHERLACLAHFAECVACREVVFLTQEPVAPEAPKAEWWRRWLAPIPALCSAAGILVLSLTIYLLHKTPPPKEEAKSTTAAADQPVEVSKSAPPPVSTAQKNLKPAPRASAKPARPADSSSGTNSTAASELSAAPNRVAEPLASAPPPAVEKPKAPVASPVLPMNGIAGTVTDPSGAAISGAHVTLKMSPATPDLNTVTDNTGTFSLSGLSPGQYEMKVQSPGFQSLTKQVKVQPDQVSRADSSLSLGMAADSVEISAQASTLSTEVSSVVKSKKSRIADPSSLPSNLAPLATVTKGKVTLTADSAGALFRSDNAGKKWKAIKPIWQDKVVELSVDPPDSRNPSFHLKTAAGSAWVSRDGNRWTREP